MQDLWVSINVFGLEVRTERGVAVLVASKWQEEVTEVKRTSERIKKKN